MLKNNDYKQKFEDLIQSFELFSNESETIKNKLNNENKLLSDRLSLF